MKPLKNNLTLKEYAQKNIVPLIAGILVLFCFLAPYLGSMRIGIDTYPYMNDNTYLYNWMELGRWAGVLLKRVLNPHFNLFYAYGAMVVILSGCMVQFCKYLDDLAEVPAGYGVLAYLLTFISPVYGLQYYFSNQVLEMAVGYFLLISAWFSSREFVLKKKKICFGAAVLLIAFIISIYQAFCILFITGVCISILFIYQADKKTNSIKGKKYPYTFMVLQYIGMFLAGYLLNMLVTRIFVKNSQYLNDLVSWGKHPVSQCLAEIKVIFKQVFTGETVYYSKLFPVFAILLILIVAAECVLTRRKEKWIYLLAGIGLILSPLLLTIYQGGYPQIRSQMAVPLAVGGMVCFVLSWFFRHLKTKIPGILLLIVVCIGMAYQMSAFSRVQYTAEFVYEQDKAVLTAIYEDASKVSGNTELRLAVVGEKAVALNDACLKEGDIASSSLLNFAGFYEPHYFYSNVSQVEFLNANGYKCSYVTAEEMLQARKEAQTMNVYPENGSIKDMGNYVIVKISEDSYMEDLIENQ